VNVKKLDRLLFGTAGVPICSPKKDTVTGILTVKEIGLDAMEIEFVYGVRMKPEVAEEARKVAEEGGVVLTAHGPYYINLLSEDKAKLEASVQRILETARVAYACGGYSITFHAAFYGKLSQEEAYKAVKQRLKQIVKQLKDEGIEIWVRPETTGKGTQFGTLEELLKLSQEVEYVMPCLDFAHMHARLGGRLNSEEEFREGWVKLEEALGREALDNLHVHVSGIEYGEKGEKKHLNLEQSDLNYEALLKVWKEFDVKGVVISESPNIEGDAILLKQLYYPGWKPRPPPKKEKKPRKKKKKKKEEEEKEEKKEKKAKKRKAKKGKK